VIDWTLGQDSTQVVERVAAIARVLRPGGVLAWPACDSRFVSTESDAHGDFAGFDRLAAGVVPPRQDGWTFARFTSAVAAFAGDHASQFELERVQRHGYYNLALLRLRGKPIVGRGVIACGDHCHALDGPFLRRITSIDTLNRLQVAGVPTIQISPAEQALFVAGPLLNPGDVAGYLAKRDVFS
jgi:hypothetical protein